MNEVQNQIFKVDTTCIKDNQVLALSVNRQDVDRCTRIICQYGLVTPPVIGNFKDGTNLLLSGECEFMALKEMGVKTVDTVAVPISIEEEGNKLSLLLSCLKKSPAALSEAIFMAQLIKTGKYTQLQLGEMLGKSASWINKRISLATRLHPAVREMVMMKQMCPHSAQEISRLPLEVQHDFAAKIVLDGLPKSAVEVLTAAFNRDGCPSSLKEQILQQPRHALSKIEQSQHVKPVSINDKKKESNVSCRILRNDLVLLMRCIKDAEEQLGGIGEESLKELLGMIQSARSSMLRLCSLLEIAIKNEKVSPGKSQEGGLLNGN